MNRPGESICHYQRAAELQSHNPLDSFHAMTLVASSKIETSKTKFVLIWVFFKEKLSLKYS